MSQTPKSSSIGRREVLAGAVGGAAALASFSMASHAQSGGGSAAAKAPSSGALTLPPLPFAIDALAPVISARTLEFHHGKHHKTYVDKTNELVAGTELAGKSLEEIVQAAAAGKDADKSKQTLFNNAAQAWNHAFYWNSLKPGGAQPSAKLLRKLESSFKSFDDFKAQLVDAAVGQFGSGWAWLVAEGDALKIAKTANADLPLLHGQRALLTLDVWEHAYYLDYQNERKKYAQAVVDKLLNWEWAERQLG